MPTLGFFSARQLRSRFAMTNRGRQCSFDRPTIPAQSVPQHSPRKVTLASPFSDGLCFVSVSDMSINPTIIHLSSLSSPTAVIGNVRTVIVDPIQSIVFWSLPHIGEEIFKEFPARIVGNPPPVVINLRWTKAPLLHCTPRNPRWCSGITMGSGPRISELALANDTSTRSSLSSCEISNHNLRVSPALASTEPITKCAPRVYSGWSLLNNCKTSENLSYKISAVMSRNSSRSSHID